MQARYWIGGSFLIVSAALIGACLEDDTPPASCNSSSSGGPDASCDGSINPFGCLGPATLIDTWIATAAEPSSKGTYDITFKPVNVDESGTFVFHRDVTYDISSPKYAGCHVLNLLVGGYIAKDGFIDCHPAAVKETRDGCANPGDNGFDNQAEVDEVFQGALRGVYTLTACSLTITNVIYTNAKIPLDGGSGGGGGGGGGDGGPAECTDALKASCFGDLACYTDIFKDCVPEGVCTAGEQVIVNGQLVAPFCFDNGVKFQSRTETSDPFLSVIDYYKSGGAFCWHADSISTSGGDNTLVYKDMNGMELATVKTFADGSQKVTCAGQPEVTLDAACRACDQSNGTSDCAKGVCTVP